MLFGKLGSETSHQPVQLGLIRSTFLICAVIFCVLSLYSLPALFPNAIGTAYICVYVVMTCLSAWVWYRGALPPKTVLLLSLTCCVLLTPLLPYTSNDAHRYLWDGAVFLSGADPYITAPKDATVSHLRAIWPTPEEHANYPTLYPPGALFIFLLCALAGPTYAIWIWKGMSSLALGLSLVLGYKLLAAKQLHKNFSLFALSPLLVFETGLGAHLDIICVLGIVSALWCVQKDKIIAAGIIIGLTATVKFLPAVLVGPFLFYLKPRSALKLFVSSALSWICIYLVMFGLGYKPLGLLPVFFEKWRGGAPFYPILESVRATIGLSNTLFLGGLIALAAIGFSISAWLARRGKIEIALALTIAVPLMLSPVLFPWYLMSLVIFLALRPSYTLLLLIILTPLSYVVLNQWLSENIWHQPHWPEQILLAGLLAGLALDFYRLKKRNLANLNA